MKHLATLIILLITFLVTACSSTTQLDANLYDKNNDPRVGDSVDRVCFNSSISGWSEVDNDRNALIVHFGVNRSYKVQLIGMCEADWAMTSIAIISRMNSSCMSTGDKIRTDAQTKAASSCTITDINEWLPQKSLDDN